MNHLGLCVRWKAMMLLVISDASAMFNLPWQFAVPDILFVKELVERHDHLLRFGLISKTMGGNLVAEAYGFHQKYIKPSVNDMLALLLIFSMRIILRVYLCFYVLEEKKLNGYWSLRRAYREVSVF